MRVAPAPPGCALPPDFLRRPIAHRALHDATAGCPENSREAVSAAVAAGYAIELDIQASAENVPMVFHDPTLERLTNLTGKVADHTTATLRATRLRDGPTAIPTLHDVLEIVSGRAPLLIEMKDQSGAFGPCPPHFETETAEALTGYRGPVAVISFNPHSIAAFGRLAPQIPRGLISEGLPSDKPAHLSKLGAFPATGASFISHAANDLDNPRVQGLRAGGVPLLTWTIRSAAAAHAAYRAGASNITFESFRPALTGPRATPPHA